VASILLTASCAFSGAGKTDKSALLESFLDVPGVTEEEVKAIEALRREFDGFIFGMSESTESYYIDDGTTYGAIALMCDWLSGFFGIPFELHTYNRIELREGLLDGTIDFSGNYTPIGSDTESFFVTMPISERPIEYARLAGNPQAAFHADDVIRYGFLHHSIAEILTLPYIGDAGIPFTIKNVGSTDEALQMLRDGELDVFLANSLVIGLFKIHPDIETGMFNPLLFKHDLISTANPRLKPIIEVLNKYFKSGGLSDLYPLHMQGQTDFLRHSFIKSLSQEELAFYNELTLSGQPIPFSVSSDNYPIGFFDKNAGEWAGISIDVLAGISRITGLRFEPSNSETAVWEEVYQMLQSGGVPMTAELLYTSDRSERFIWTDIAYTTTRYVLVSASEHENIILEQVSFKHVGTIKGTGYEEMFHNWFPSHAHTTSYNTVVEGIDAIERGEIDLLMMTEGRFLTVTNYLERSGFKINLILDYKTESRFGFTQDETLLRGIMTKAQALVDTDTISNYWNYRVFDYQVELAKSRNIYTTFLSALLLCILVLVAVLFVRSREAGKRLEKIVLQRTGELEKRNKLMLEIQEDLKIAVDDAQVATQAKSDFLANMSHELRTPMNVIIGLTELLLEEDTPKDDLNENLSKINTAGATLVSLINDVLDISKIESGKAVLTPAQYEIASLLNDVITLNMARFGKKPIIFDLNIADDVYSNYYGDDLRLKQILNNLLSNAFKYTREGRVALYVGSRRHGENEAELTFRVSDTGIGIHEDDIARIFMEYNQVDTSANREIEGTGLGLPITKSFIELMGGEITVDSEYGKGTTFNVRIRQGIINEEILDRETIENLRSFKYEDSRKKEEGRLVRPDLRWARAMVVDDSRSNLDVASGLLSKYKMKLDCVSNGRDAIDLIKKGEPAYDAVFMDHMMPGMDGVETTHRIRALESGYAKHLPVIALTANAVAGTQEFFLENGFQAYLTKPINILKLDAVIREWIMKEGQEKIVGQVEKEREGKIAGQVEKEGQEKQEKKGIPAETPLQSDEDIEIPGINAKRGLMLYEGDEDLFIEIMRSYVENTPAEIDKLREVSRESLPDYAINVHTVKGASSSIGATDITRRARHLEMLSKSGDLDGILSRNEAFLRDADTLLENLKAWLDKRDSALQRKK